MNQEGCIPGGLGLVSEIRADKRRRIFACMAFSVVRKIRGKWHQRRVDAIDHILQLKRNVLSSSLNFLSQKMLTFAVRRKTRPQGHW